MSDRRATSEPSSRRRSTALGRWYTRVSCAVCVCLWACALAWIFGDLLWEADLIANLGAQFALFTSVALVLWIATRRWKLAAFALAALLVHGSVMGRGRACWTAPAMELNTEVSDAARSRGVVRILHYNASARGDEADVVDLIRASRADIAEILVPPVPMQGRCIYGSGTIEGYAGKAIREWQSEPNSEFTRVSPCIVLSRWPVRDYETQWAGAPAEHLLACIVERPGGEFGVIAVHPRSPRTSNRWRLGNEVTLVVAAVARRMQSEGFGVVVLTDLNSTPTGWRSRELCSEGGLRRSKPVLKAAGTYPGEYILPGIGTVPATWPGSLAIDDVLISRDIEVEAWWVGEPIAWQHRPVIVDAAVPITASRRDQVPQDSAH